MFKSVMRAAGAAVFVAPLAMAAAAEPGSGNRALQPLERMAQQGDLDMKEAWYAPGRCAAVLTAIVLFDDVERLGVDLVGSLSRKADKFFELATASSDGDAPLSKEEFAKVLGEIESLTLAYLREMNTVSAAGEHWMSASDLVRLDSRLCLRIAG